MSIKPLFQLVSAIAVGTTALLGVGPANAAPTARQNVVTVARRLRDD